MLLKSLFFCLFTSFFFFADVCKAQSKSAFSSKDNHGISICSRKDSLLRQDQIVKLFDEGCNKVIYTDANGKELKLTKYLISITSGKNGNAYFEQITGDLIPQNVMERIRNTNPGDKIIVAQIKNNPTNGNAANFESNATRIYKIVK